MRGLTRDETARGAAQNQSRRRDDRQGRAARLGEGLAAGNGEARFFAGLYLPVDLPRRLRSRLLDFLKHHVAAALHVAADDGAVFVHLITGALLRLVDGLALGSSRRPGGGEERDTPISSPKATGLRPKAGYEIPLYALCVSVRQDTA